MLPAAVILMSVSSEPDSWWLMPSCPSQADFYVVLYLSQCDQSVLRGPEAPA